MEGDPEIILIRKEIYNPEIEDYEREEIPTETIKRFGRTRGTASTLMASYSGLGMRQRAEGGSYDATGRVVRLGLVADRAMEIGIIDRTGTVDDILIPSSGRYDAQGAAYKPLYNLVGSVRIRALGSPSAGTFAASFEIKKRIEGTFTIR